MKCLESKNQTAVTEFFFLGILANYWDHHLIFIMLFLIFCLLSFIGNVFLIAATKLDPQLHTPMYFFIGNLSFADLCLTSVTAPKYLDNLLSKRLSISLHGCIAQMYLFLWFVSTESCLLAMMAYDRYAAICNPLQYTLTMNKRFCVLLVATSWALAFFHAFLYVSLTFHHCFCGPNIINSFFCDQPPVLALSCSDTSFSQLVLLYEAIILTGSLFFFILSSYTWIISTILKLRSAQARKKSFLTCSSHLTVIILFYGTGGSAYFLPSSVISKENNILVSMMYALVTPTINPYIYSLRNKEMKTSLKKALGRISCHRV